MKLFKHDDSEIRVTSELGGTVSVIDPGKHVVTRRISSDVRGPRSEHIQPVGIRFSPENECAFVALGPTNRVAATDATSQTIPVGRLPWGVVVAPT